MYAIAPPSNANNTQEVLDILKNYKKDLMNETHTHVCSRDYCNPQTHEQLIRTGQCPPSAGRPNTEIYLCKYRQYHICNYEYCHCTICPISGACYGAAGGYSSYDHGDNRTWNSKPEVDDQPTFFVLSGPKREREEEKEDDEEEDDDGPSKKTKPTNTADFRRRIEEHIEALLYSSVRIKINNDYTTQNNKSCSREKDGYINKCRKEGVPVNRIVLDMINDRYKHIILPMTILKEDRDRVAYYIESVMQVYDIVQRYSSSEGQNKICITSVTLATLYFMRTSYQVDGITLIPLDGFLKEHLPSLNELPRFSFDKKKYTRGSKLLTFSYEVALRRGVPILDLCLKFKETKTAEVYALDGTDLRKRPLV